MRGVNRSWEVDESQVDRIMWGDLADPTESTLGSRVEAVRRLDLLRPSMPHPAARLADLLGVTTRTIERYRAKIKADTLG